MSAFLFLLVKLNLAMGMAILLVALLRRFLRAWFGAALAYAIWFAVPIAGFASLLPPRVAALPTHLVPAHLPAGSLSVIADIAPSAMRAAEQLARQGAHSPAAIAAPPAASAYALPDTTLLLFAAWAVGLLLMALYLIRLQLRFSAAVRAGQAGPAVLGFLRPRIVMPDSFLDRFTPQEQAAILAHERIHLARQDARINALMALLRCLCWFNPLIHLGARWLRIDQELACDASAVAAGISRRTYAKALLKSQLMVMALPLGCNWPGSQHPLIERIALLKDKPPSAPRRLAGAGLVLLAASLTGLSAWAAQPPLAAKGVVAKAVAAPFASMTLAAPSTASIAAPDQPAAQTASAPAMAEPTPNNNDVDRPKSRAVLPAPVPVRVQMASTGNIEGQIKSDLAALPEAAPSVLALNAAAGSPKSFTTPSAPAAEDLVVATTPSGVGDPDAIVCRAPQPIAGSEQFGPEACGHNYEWWRMAIAGKDLAPDGKTLIDKPMVKDPDGHGDPDAVTCRIPKFVMRGPLVEVCRTNRFWAAIIENHQVVDAYGEVRERQAPGIYYGPEPGFGTDSAVGLGVTGNDPGQPAQSAAVQGTP